MNYNCPYSDECGILASCDETCCRVKELFDDFYKVEKLYTDAKIQIIGLKQGNNELKQKLEKIKEVCCKCKNDTDMYVRMYGYNMYVSKIQEIIEE